MSKSQTKTMFITFFDIKGTVQFELIPQSPAVNQVYHVETLKWLHEAVRRKRPEFWTNDRILHHENAPAHKALKQFLAQKSIIEMKHPPYFPDLALSGFYLKRTEISGY